MSSDTPFFRALGITEGNELTGPSVAKHTGIPLARLRHYARHNLVPTGADLDAITRVLGLSEDYLRIVMGKIDRQLAHRLSENALAVEAIIGSRSRTEHIAASAGDPVLETPLGKLFRADCMEFLPSVPDQSVDLVFADPPFNLKKFYPSEIDDDLKTEQYLDWSEKWIRECVRVLKHGGSFFLWNLPRWNTEIANMLSQHLVFRHWIAVDIKFSLPIAGRLYPSHYSLLYFIKNEKPDKFHPDRLPMPTCPHCNGDLKDYGGYKNKMNPAGVNMSDVWTDIPPVRHAKYKRRNGANELSLKLLDRVIEMGTDPGDAVLDPFGGSGTTFMAAELKGRKWIGCEIGPCDDIVARFDAIESERQILADYRSRLNSLFPPDVLRKRESAGLWTAESVAESRADSQADLFGKK